MSGFCIICKDPLTASENVIVDRGMKTLIAASAERGDEFTDYLKSQKSVAVHVQCRKNYTRRTTIAAVKRQHEEDQASTSKTTEYIESKTKNIIIPRGSKKSPPRTTAHVSESDFCFKNHCLFCGNEANKEYEKKRAQKYRRKICMVSTLSFKESVLKIAQSRSDDNSKTITARIGFEHDLVAAEARYHRNCYIYFLKPPTGGKNGRPRDEAVILAMEEIFAYIENSDDCQFTLGELKRVCKNSNIDNRTVKLHLKLKYGDKVIITEKPGHLTFISFTDNHYTLLNQAWSEKKNKSKRREI
ncbi:unnamed protein product [Euphydryas editha]|uniref:Uncharacterized protein n=1 Tax=Euphydryas editha TaxID=104508 RepID=A0AAU9TBF2_EUPED|nr:unnamed protein product [Euphydryas editha]